MFKGNTPITIYSYDLNRYAEKELVKIGGEICTPLSGRSGKSISSIRADASSSRGRGEIKTGEYLVQLSPSTEARPDSVVQIEGEFQKHEVAEMRPMRDISGKIDHYEATCKLWQG